MSTLQPTRWVPPQSTVVAPGGSHYVTTTPQGTQIAWDTCGRCGVHVLHCRCAGSRAPRSVVYLWHQDRAFSRHEEWSPDHPDYRRDFEAQEGETPQRKFKRLRR